MTFAQMLETETAMTFHLEAEAQARFAVDELDDSRTNWPSDPEVER
jgi:hypothetical protein